MRPIDLANNRRRIISQAPDTEAPTVPSSLVLNNPTSSTLDWSFAGSIDNTAVVDYVLELRDEGSILIRTYTVTSISGTFTGLNTGKVYKFKAKARDDAGNESAYSAFTALVSTL